MQRVIRVYAAMLLGMWLKHLPSVALSLPFNVKKAKTSSRVMSDLFLNRKAVL
jgi:hypothetical protein